MQMSSMRGFFNNQVLRMVSFIEHEALEKQEEIELKAEGEFCSEKGRIIKEARHDMINSYNKKQKLMSKQQIVDISTMKNEARIRCLAVTEAHVSNIEAEVQARMVRRMMDQTFYEDILFNLIMQALCVMIEKEVILKVREEDLELTKGMCDKIQAAYEDFTSSTVTLKILNETLPNWTLGGVELTSRNRKYFVRNTLHSRLKLIIQDSIPLIREGLFGYVPKSSIVDFPIRKMMRL